MPAFGQVSAPTEFANDAGFAGARFLGPEQDTHYLEREIIPAIFSTKKPGDQIRLWVMDCGRGEAAYLLAMLLCEANIDLAARLLITVFATDTDPHSLAIARNGQLDQTLARGVSPNRLRRWFLADDRGYTVVKELRSTCTFSIHDMTLDVPFSHMDLICCGEALRRLPPEQQDKAVPLLHFALRSGGYLLPFADECMVRHPKLFSPAQGTSSVYCRMDGGRRFFPAFPLSSRSEAGIDGAGDFASLAETESARDGHVHWLQSELRWTKDQLRSTIGQLRAANRTLQFSNEEYQSLNEELRSTNEELQTSKVELQALNRELGMVNDELSHRIGELRRTNSDVRNLLNSTQISTLFLDRQLNITRFTPAVAEIFHIIESDVGRCITDIACELAYDELPEDVAQATRTLGVVERKLNDPRNGAHYLVRVVPYRDADDTIAGAVLTFLDITPMLHAEAALQGSEARFRDVVSSVPAALFVADADMAWTYVNPRFYEFTGLPKGVALGSGWLAAVHPEDRGELELRLEQARRSNTGFEYEFRLRDVAKGYRWYFLRAIRSSDVGELTGWTGSLLDTHDRRTAESRQRLLFIELQRRVKATLGNVRLIAGHTKGANGSMEDFFAHFDGRLDAIARAQASIARDAELGVDLEDLLSEEILTHATGCEDRVNLSGPTLHVGGRAGQALGLAIHELTTNALKFGALSRSAGSVDVSWRLREDERGRCVHLEWKERTVPVVDPNPRRVGFGRDFLERKLAIELDGSTRLAFQPGGVRYTVDFPLPSSEPAGGEP